MKKIVDNWFDTWRKGDFRALPITEDFSHTSPFGTIRGKENYLKLVEENQRKFMGYTFNIHDEIYDNNKACVRYTGAQGDFNLDVSEWYYFRGSLIKRIIAYYHIGEIREERKLINPDSDQTR